MPAQARSKSPGRVASPTPKDESPSSASTPSGTSTKAAAKANKSKGGGLLNKGSNMVVMLMLAYMGMVCNSFRGILWPKFPDIDPRTHSFLEKYQNIIQSGDKLRARYWVDTTAWPPSKKPLAEFEFAYDWDATMPEKKTVNVSISQKQLNKGTNQVLSVEVVHLPTGKVVRAKGGLVKSMPKPDTAVRYHMHNGSVCLEDPEPQFGKKDHLGRGIPFMQVRLVYDDYAYPPPWKRGPYLPQLFVDEFWLTNDQLVKLNTTGTNRFNSEVHVALMSAARWRFQNHMEYSFKQNAQLFGEDSEEMLQMRDLFANTNPILLAVTLVVSMLHMVFEFLAFKNDVQFFNSCSVETLNTYVSVQSILFGILMQILLLMYLWDESSNIIVLITSAAQIVVDMWKVTKAMKPGWVRVLGIPVPWMKSKVTKAKADDFDTIAMKYLALILSPGVVVYGFYTFFYDCHKGWYSLFLTFSASIVYSLGFVLMTPQVFINYKHKTVAYLPWRKFVYRAINTFIDDLFAFIIRMPTMHRMSCFRDDIVFLIYLWQRRYYVVDKNRMFDEDGYELSPEEQSANQDPSGAHDDSKKDK